MGGDDVCADPIPDNPPCVIGVDLGGTNFRVAVADDIGNIEEVYSYPIAELRARAEGILCFVQRRLRELIQSNPGVRCVAIGIPGVVREDGTRAYHTDNLPELEGIDLKVVLSLPPNVGLALDNDLNMAALGETVSGKCTGCKHVVFVGLGTGLGLGIVIDGKVYRGRHNMAGELGSILVASQDNGSTGLVKLESILSGSGIENMWEARSARRDGAKEVFRLAALRNPDAHSVISTYILHLKLALLGIAFVLSPEKIVLGGGTTASLQPYLDELRSFLERRLHDPPAIELTSLRGHAGIIGAVHAALRHAGLG